MLHMLYEATQNKIRVLQSASELYRPWDRRLSAKLVPDFDILYGDQQRQLKTGELVLALN
jgi:hypothetical protein